MAKKKVVKAKQMVFKVQAEDDTIYVKGGTKKEASVVLHKHMGYIPEEMLTWTGPMELPRGQTAFE